MTPQPSDNATSAAAKPKPVYRPATLRLIKRARVTRDLILFVGCVAFAVASFVVPAPAYTVNDPIGIFAVVLAVVFGVAALMRGLMEPKWDRDWPLAVRYGLSVLFIVVGGYFMVFALDHGGYSGARGTGVATDCRYESSDGLGRSGGTHSYDCDLDVHWPDGTTTHEHLEATLPVHDGQTIAYTRSPTTGPLSVFAVGAQPVAAWTEVWFYFLAGLAMTGQSLYALGVLIFARRPKRA